MKIFDLAITNIEKIVSGSLKKGILDANTILVKDGKIAEVSKKEVDFNEAKKIIDVDGMIVTPGLIDPHVHPCGVGDWHSRIKTFGWMEYALHGGVTTMLSEGDVHLLGRPHDPAGVKALAILSHKIYQNFKPGSGLKVYGGAVLLEKGLTEKDFQEMANEGVWLVAEIGVSGLLTPDELIRMTKWARRYGMKISVHCGGSSLPGGITTAVDNIIQLNPDVVAHVDGGPTALALDDIKRLVDETELNLEVIYNGNPKMMFEVVNLLKKKERLNRLIIGSDTPTAFAVAPLAILRTIIRISSLNEISADKVIAAATGNTARVYGLNTGEIEVGREADMVIMDCPPGSTVDNALESIEFGDTPGIAMVISDGMVIPGRLWCRTSRTLKIDGLEQHAPTTIQDFI